MPDRFDRRGRRIGRNWWREMNCDTLLDARLAWEAEREKVAMGYATEMKEYERDNPQPNLKDFLLRNAGTTPIV